MTETAARMRKIVDSIAPDLRAVGFKKRRYSFNRSMPDGIVHVVYFWMGAYDPSGKHAVPGLIPDYHGTFTIRIGIYLPAMKRGGASKSDWINEYNCQLTWGIGELLPEAQDVWWKLNYPGIDEIARAALFGPGLSKLDHFPNEETIVQTFESGGRQALNMHPAAPLDFSEVYRSRGDSASERRTLERYVNGIVEEGTAHSGHASYLQGFLREQGYSDLADLLDENRRTELP